MKRFEFALAMASFVLFSFSQIAAQQITTNVDDQPIPGVRVVLQSLPEGAVYATANVSSDSTIEVQQEGYAVVATANVQSIQKVNPGDHLSASSVVSMLFKDGSGLLISTLMNQPRQPISATVGSSEMISEDHPQPLPINKGSLTTYVACEQPFSRAALVSDNMPTLPSKTYASVLNSKGDKVGELDHYTNIKYSPGAGYKIAVEDPQGAILKQASVSGGAFDGSAGAAFNKPEYRPNEKGTLLLSNQENYLKMYKLTRYGGDSKIAQMPIRIQPISDIKGLPPETPLNTKHLSFIALHPGEVKAIVYFPGAQPPSEIDPGDNKFLQEPKASFEHWLKQGVH